MHWQEWGIGQVSVMFLTILATARLMISRHLPGGLVHQILDYSERKRGRVLDLYPGQRRDLARQHRCMGGAKRHTDLLKQHNLDTMDIARPAIKRDFLPRMPGSNNHARRRVLIVRDLLFCRAMVSANLATQRVHVIHVPS